MRTFFQRLGNRVRGGINRLRQRFGRGGAGAATPAAPAAIARTEGTTGMSLTQRLYRASARYAQRPRRGARA